MRSLAVLLLAVVPGTAQVAPGDLAGAREAALQAGADSVAVGLAIVERWIREAPVRLTEPAEPSLEKWSERELLHRLEAREFADRALAYDEAARRRSGAALAVIRRRLESGSGPRGESIGLLEAASMIEALGVGRDSSAVPQLMEYAAAQGPYVRAYVYHALGQIGDPRALGLLRPGLLGPCGWSGGVSTMDADIRSIANLGDSRDLPQLARVARDCVPSRSWALAAIGAIGGTGAAIDTMVAVLGPKPSVTQVLSFADLGNRIQRMAAERRAVRREAG